MTKPFIIVTIYGNGKESQYCRVDSFTDLEEAKEFKGENLGPDRFGDWTYSYFAIEGGCRPIVNPYNL